MAFPGRIDIKLVRGAYWKNKNQPQGFIWNSGHDGKQRTDECYNALMERFAHAPNIGRLTAGTHNEESVKRLTKLQAENRPGGPELMYGKLRGFGEYMVPDNIPCSDYMPFGEILKAAYMTRRGTDLMSATDGGKSRGKVEFGHIMRELRARAASTLHQGDGRAH